MCNFESVVELAVIPRPHAFPVLELPSVVPSLIFEKLIAELVCVMLLLDGFDFGIKL